MSTINDNWGLIGHGWAVNLLAARIAGERAMHACLITGPEQIGKTTLALRMAQAMLCTGDSPPCGVCRPCDLIARGVHPDVPVVEPEGNSIRIETIRDLQNLLSLRPFEARCRIAIILNFQKATDQAADSLLKMLEEPPSASRLVLTADAGETVRPTIVSRCHVIPLRPVPVVEIEHALVQSGMDPHEAHLLAHLSGGRPGWALNAARHPEILEQRAQIIDEMLAVLRGDRVARFAYSEELAGRDSLPLILETWQSWWRDVLLIAEGSEVEPVNIDYMDEMKSLADQITAEQARRALRGICSTGDALNKNANTRLALDVMLLDMPRIA